MHPSLNIALKAARRAANIINRASLELERLHIERKKHNDFVTEIDRAAEDAIVSTLREVYPDYAILAEESGAQGQSNAAYEWVIDPLDGTTNFLHGLPQYAISIALRREGVVEHALVFDPNRNELFTASKGVGAFLNDRRIRVSKCSRLSDALIGTGFPYRSFEHMDAYLGIFKALCEQCSGLRRPGAAALDLCYVASGRYDGFFEFGLAPWDMAAGSLILSEAGGLVSDMDGKGNYLTNGNIVAATPKVFHTLLQLVDSQVKRFPVATGDSAKA